MKPKTTSDFLSTAEVAQALGVSVSTVKRWVENQILPAQKTAGGHRKLLWADVLEIARRENLPTADPARRHEKRRRKAAPPTPAALEESVYHALLNGDATELRSLLIGAYRAGMSIETMADQVISSAMRRIGHDWETDRIDVMHEHRGTQLCAAALFELKAHIEKSADRSRPLAVGGAIEGDYSTLPTLLAQIVLTDAGWDAINLGANTPLPSLWRAAAEMRPRMLWLSISHLVDPAKFLRDYRALYKQAEQEGIAIVIGGRALSESIRASIPYSCYGDGLTHLAAFARTLNPRPRRPKRGRPPGA